MSLVLVPGTPTWLCGYGFQGNHSSKNCGHGSKGDRYPTDQTNDILGGLASLAHGEITLAFVRDAHLQKRSTSFPQHLSQCFLCLSYLMAYIRVGPPSPGASMEAQAESGPLPRRDLSTPTCQYLRDRLGCLPLQSLSHL